MLDLTANKASSKKGRQRETPNCYFKLSRITEAIQYERMFWNLSEL